jgi:hypothetical protein
MPQPLNRMNLGDAANVPTRRTLRVQGKLAGQVHDIPQVRVGWWWTYSKLNGWYFTSRLDRRHYPPDAVFVPLYADERDERYWI